MPAPSPLLRAALFLVAVLALALPAWVVTHPPAIQRELPITHPVRVIPPAVLPPVEPVQFRDVSREDALAINAAIPFSTGPNPAAKPFVFRGGSADLARARDCLAAAMWYEAGDDPVGERAVGQVILNRVRHPAFPATVCGVVFQGAERRTGCQFTFTCDGALIRTPSPEAWERARDLAGAAIGGAVYAPVGMATHYHTNWVVPYWSSSLDKIVEINTHIFFRWTGWWGTPPAFRGRQAGAEPAVAKMARLSPVHAGAVPQGAADLAMAGMLSLTGAAANPVVGDPDTFIAQLDPTQPHDVYRVLALATCGERPRCKFMGWTDTRDMPARMPLTPAQIGAMAFSYLRDREAGFEKPLWNCQLFPDVAPATCMRRQQVMTALPVTPATDPNAPAPAAGTNVAQGLPTGWEGLFGVRRRTATPGQAPAPTPTLADVARAPGVMPSPTPTALAAKAATPPPVRRTARPAATPIAKPTSRAAAVRPRRTAPAPAPSPSPRRPRSAAGATPPRA